MDPREKTGILAGIASSAIGGMATAVTRYAVASMDPVVVTLFRFGIGCLLLLPLALALRSRWPAPRDLLAAAALGIMFYGGFFVALAYALTYTTAARGALGIATLPVVTMLVAAALRRETMTARKSAGVLLAILGVTGSLYAGLRTAPPGAWRGDLTMLSAMASMALYTILSRPLIGRSSALGYACFGMAAGAAALAAIVWSVSRTRFVFEMSAHDWSSAIFLGVFPGAVGFFLWVFAAERTTPTRVASTITVNPISAGALAAVLVDEPLTLGLFAGIGAVAIGIWFASTENAPAIAELPQGRHG